jgi:hypothetical protein
VTAALVRHGRAARSGLANSALLREVGSNSPKNHRALLKANSPACLNFGCFSNLSNNFGQIHPSRSLKYPRSAFS